MEAYKYSPVVFSPAKTQVKIHQVVNMDHNTVKNKRHRGEACTEVLQSIQVIPRVQGLPHVQNLIHSFMKLPEGIGKAIKEGWMRVLRKFGTTRSCSMLRIGEAHNVEVLKWVFDNKEWKTYEVMEAAECYGRQDLINWIITNDPAFDWGELRAAPLMTRRGRQKTLDSETKWYPSESVLVNAASQGQFDLVRKIQSKSSVYDVKVAMAEAATNGHCEVLEFLLTEHEAYNRRLAVQKAAANGRLDALILLLRTEWEVCKSLLVTAMEISAESGQVHVMEYLHSQYCRDEDLQCVKHFIYTDNLLVKAASAGQSDSVAFLLRHDPCKLSIFRVVETLFHYFRCNVIKVICTSCTANDLLEFFHQVLTGYRCFAILEAVYTACPVSTFNEALNLVLPELTVPTERNREAIDFLHKVAQI
ncbi:hypothetical protein F443_10759 [Phytophthora nicotianae P1569]|uniref:Ankyrin repeat-containing domain n=1 Tax=Phytophthora nicotianae P1569 TaxID=1317065 RepID=V9EZ56_PHYNI|nr:hypothetical protein F443_10759 [Phytophthora nicotianae P1569]